MEYKNKKMYSQKSKDKMGYPKGYYEMGMKKDSYDMDDGDYECPFAKVKKMGINYHDIDGYKMHGKKHYGPEGHWGI